MDHYHIQSCLKGTDETRLNIEEKQYQRPALIEHRITVDGMTSRPGGSSYAKSTRLNGHNWSSGL